MKKPTFHRRGFKEVREDVEKEMQDEYQSELVDDLKKSNFIMERDGVKVYLAKVRTVCRKTVFTFLCGGKILTI